MPNVKQIVEEYLEKHGYDGLYDEDICDCGEHDFHIGCDKEKLSETVSGN